MKPVDIISLVLILALSVITLFFVPSIPSWKILLGKYFLLSVSIFALALYNVRSNTWKPAKYLYAFLPAFIVPVIFDILGDLIPGIWSHYFDPVLIRIDHSIFGVHPTVWLERFISPTLTDALQLAYVSYYPMAIVLGVVLFAGRKREEFDKAIFGIILCFYLSYIGYILVPAVGPRFTLADLQSAGLQGSEFTRSIQETLNSLERNKTDAFPSGHTAVALMTLYYSWKFREKLLAGVLTPVVLALIFSTVYLRYHYVIDVMAGVLLALFNAWLAPKLYARLSPSSGMKAGL
jgi:membrane-associated phospholipid phosphatase